MDLLHEEAIISACLCDSQAIVKIYNLITPKHFFRESHAAIYTALTELYKNNITIDLVTVSDYVTKNGLLEKSGGLRNIASLAGQFHSSANIERYAFILKEHYMKRILRIKLGDLYSNTADDKNNTFELLNKVEQLTNDLNNELTINAIQSNEKPLQKIVENALNSQNNNEIQPSGLHTGLYLLDNIISGLNDDVVLLAARPSMGKTALALTICKNLVEDGKRVLFFSLEMSKYQLLQRWVSMDAEVPMQDIRHNKLTQNDVKKILESTSKIEKLGLVIDETPSLTINEIKAKAQKEKYSNGIDLIVIDYIQLISTEKGESREREVANISRSLVQMKKVLGVPIIALAQLNRGVEKRIDKTPYLSDLRESGSLEQDADIVLLLNRREYYKIDNYDDMMPTENTAEIDIAKNRNGSVGTIRVHFDKQYTKFRNLDF